MPTPTPPLTLSDVVRSGLASIPAVRRVLDGYVTGLARDVGLLTQPLVPSRLPDVRRLAHQLRGSGGAYGFDQITELATVVESAIDDGHSLDEVAADIDALVALIRRVEGYDPAAEYRTRSAAA